MENQPFFLKCRFCDSLLRHTFVDLGMTPLSNSYLTLGQLGQMEPTYPLHARVCENCFLVQVPEFQSPEQIFTEYAYFSSYSESWLEHSRLYAEEMIRRYHLGSESLVIEVASNDGYLLQYFKQNEVPILGVEPARNVATVAEKAGIPTLVEFVGERTARGIVERGYRADLLIGNNVFGHVPNVNDFVAGLKILLKEEGVLTLEFPHLLRLIEGNEFDTIYHEHFSYWSILTAEKVFAKQGLIIFDIEELPTHGGSLRIFVRHEDNSLLPITNRVEEIRNREIAAGLNQIETYQSFAAQVRETKSKLLEFMIEAKRQGKTVVGYGAPAKGNTLLNYCGVFTDFVDYTVDRNPRKQDHFLPGTCIPIFHPDKIGDTKPDYLLILPWNLKDEIMEQMAFVRDWGCQFVIPIPHLEVVA
jgi:hypothetical protein